MEYAIIFIFHEGKWLVAQRTELENVIKMETREIEPQDKQSGIILQQKKLNVCYLLNRYRQQKCNYLLKLKRQPENNWKFQKLFWGQMHLFLENSRYVFGLI